ncbi:MAG: helix-turn-helix transcriptional regulator [Mameliella sp.]|nr:helix-turn-helix transcriptional regulator [Phaeodactylibacter sp.]
MQIEVSNLLAIFFSGIGVLGCIFFGFQLWWRKPGVQLTNRLLSSLLILVGLAVLNQLMALGGIYSQYQYLYFLPIVITLSFGPLFYFFVKSKLSPSFEFRKKDWAHFLLPAMQFLFYCYVGSRSMERKSEIWRFWIQPYGQYIEQGLVLVSTFGYLWMAYQFLNRAVPRPAWKQPVVKWLNRFTLVLGGTMLINLAYDVVDMILYGLYEYNLFNTPWLDFPLQMANAFMALWLVYNAWLYNHQRLILPKVIPTAKETSLGEQIQSLFKDDELHRDPELDLDSLSKRLGLHRNQLSRWFSESGSSFREMVNQYRVEDFIKLAQDDAFSHFSLLAIAHEAGFNSKATFNRVFKKHTGQSPSAYMKETRLSKSALYRGDASRGVKPK